MAKPEEILIDNFRESLRQLQVYIIWGIGSSLSYLILSTSVPKPGQTPASIPIPGAFIAIDPGIARVIALSIYWVVGAMATYAFERAQRIAETLRNNPQLLNASLTFPSIATETYTLVRLIPALLPLFLFLSAIIAQWLKGEYRGDAMWGYIFWMVIMVSPYLALASQMLSPIKPAEVRSYWPWL